MKKEYYVVDECNFVIRKALLDLESGEWHWRFIGDKKIKCWNELYEDSCNRTGRSYKSENIFDNELAAKEGLKETILESHSRIQGYIDNLKNRQNELMKLYNSI